MSPILKSGRLLAALTIALLCGALISTAKASANITLTWNPNASADLSGYNVYCGTSSGEYTQKIEAGNVTSITIDNLTDGATYYFVVAAVDNSGMESAPSGEIAIETPTVEFTGINDGSSFDASAAITLSATTSETGGGITEVDYYDGSTLIGTSDSGSYSVVWNGALAGDHVITAVAYDADGSSSSTNLTISVVPLIVTATGFGSDGSFQLSVTGAIGRTDSVYYSSDLANWTLLTAEVNTTGALSVSDPGADGITPGSQRYYKVVSD